MATLTHSQLDDSLSKRGTIVVCQGATMRKSEDVGRNRQAHIFAAIGLAFDSVSVHLGNHGH